MIGNRYATGDDHLNNRDAKSMVGLVGVMNHPQGPQGGGMVRVVDAEDVTVTKTFHSGSQEGEEYEVDGVKFTAVDVLTGREYYGNTAGSIPALTLPEKGSTYRVYQLQHQKGNEEWVDVGPMSSHRHRVANYYGGYEGHENQRLKMYMATYIGQKESYYPEEVVKHEEFTCRLPDDEDGIDKSEEIIEDNE